MSTPPLLLAFGRVDPQRLSPYTPFQNAVIVCDGNSLTLGTGSSDPYPTQLQRAYPFLRGGAVVTNHGINSITTPQMTVNAPTAVDPRYRSGVKSILIANEMGNDILLNGVDGAVAFAHFATYMAAREAVGWLRVAWTCPPRANVDDDTLQDANEALLASVGVCDVVVDVRTNPLLATINPTAYNPDNIHLNATGDTELLNMIIPAVLSL